MGGNFFRDQGGNAPGAVLRHGLSGGGAVGLVKGGGGFVEDALVAAFFVGLQHGDELLASFPGMGGAVEGEDAPIDVLDAFLPSLSGLLDGDAEGQMSDERDVAQPRFFGEREVGGTGDVENFDEIGTLCLELVDGATSFVGGAHGAGVDGGGLLDGEHGAREIESGSGTFAFFDLRAPAFESLEIATHISDRSDAELEQLRKQDIGAPGGVGVDACEVHVHIPEPGNDVAAGVQDVGFARHGGGGMSGLNAAGGKKDVLMGEGLPGFDVDDGDIVEKSGGRLGRGPGGDEQERSEESAGDHAAAV